MHRWTQRPQLRLITELSITPFLTVVLMLLLVFMLAGPLLHESATDARPGTSDHKNEPPATTALLVLDKSGTISLDGEKVPLANLKDHLASRVKDQPGLGVQVQLDRDLPVQVLVELMDVLKQAGVQKTAITTVGK
ncbi:MAG: biopolymer transporter ExbD [Verrucomicrobiaceae bacterium]|nr:biopolymer transporter ExbD [Verrucomicrobiaceae bacterium]